MSKKIIYIILLFLLLFLSACSNHEVKPNDKEKIQLITNFHKANMAHSKIKSKYPLVFFLGGSEGGIISSDSKYVKSLIKNGYNVVTVAYFGLEGINPNLNKVNINSFEKAINKYKTYPNVDDRKIVFIGISKGAELSLLLASIYPEIHTVVAMVPSNVVFQASNITLSQDSSWLYDGEEVPFVPYPRFSWNTIKGVFSGDNFRDMHIEALENTQAVKKAKIKVENINGNIYLLSAKYDNIWPSTEMSNDMMNRLKNKNFSHTYKHKVLDMNHFILDDDKTWSYVIDFLKYNI